MINFAHCKHGLKFTYSVAPSEELLLFANFVIALASACSTYGLVNVSILSHPSQWSRSHNRQRFSSTYLVSSHLFSNPDGQPLYPSEIIMLSLTMRHPTLRLSAYEFSAHILAIRRYFVSNLNCFSFVMLFFFQTLIISFILYSQT